MEKKEFTKNIKNKNEATLSPAAKEFADFVMDGLLDEVQKNEGKL